MISETRTGTPAATESPPDPAWAWAPYVPDAKRPWDLRRAGHLYRRAAFGASWGQLQQALRDGPARTVDRLLRPEADVAAFDRTFDAYEDGGHRPRRGHGRHVLRMVAAEDDPDAPPARRRR